jgi:hypothetical protein
MANDIVLRPQNFEQLSIFAQMAAKSSMVPAAYRGKVEDVMLAVQMGSEVGLAPMQALQNIAVVNGRPSLWGDAMLALCKMHPAWGGIKETCDGEGDKMRAVCEVHRKGDHPVTVTFTAEDAKRAGLLGKAGPWQQYPKRMMQMRARGFALRDAFPDALRGLISAEEAQDIPADNFKGTTITVTPEPFCAKAETASVGKAGHLPTPTDDHAAQGGDVVRPASPPEPVNTAPPKRTVREIVRDKLAACFSTDDVANVADDPLVAKALRDAPLEIKLQLNEMLGAAYARFAVAADDGGAAAEPEQQKAPPAGEG